MRFNVGGHVFLTRKRNFACFPFSRLGRLMRTKDSRYGIHPTKRRGKTLAKTVPFSRRVLDLCDAFDPGYDDTTLGGKRYIFAPEHFRPLMLDVHVKLMVFGPPLRGGGAGGTREKGRSQRKFSRAATVRQ